jgi:hypothetical protein
VQGGDEGAVGLVGKVERAAAVGVGFECFDGVVDYGVGVKVLCGTLAVVCS